MNDTSLIPRDATALPGDEPCRGLGHKELSWTEESEPTETGGTRSWISEAKCGCGRTQSQIRIVYPPERNIEVRGPDAARA